MNLFRSLKVDEREMYIWFVVPACALKGLPFWHAGLTHSPWISQGFSTMHVLQETLNISSRFAWPVISYIRPCWVGALSVFAM